MRLTDTCDYIYPLHHHKERHKFTHTRAKNQNPNATMYVFDNTHMKFVIPQKKRKKTMTIKKNEKQRKKQMYFNSN